MCVNSPFLFVLSIPLDIYTTICLSVHQLVGIWVQFFTITNKTAMDIHVYVFTWTYFFSYMVGVCLTFSETATPFAEWLNHFASPPAVYENDIVGIPLLTGFQ